MRLVDAHHPARHARAGSAARRCARTPSTSSRRREQEQVAHPPQVDLPAGPLAERAPTPRASAARSARSARPRTSPARRPRPSPVEPEPSSPRSSEQHVLHARLGEVEGDARADHPAADDHHGSALHRRGYATGMSITETRTVGSIIGGEDRERGRAASSRATPRTSTTSSARPLLGDADTFVDACRAARAAQREWAAVPAPVRGNVDQADRPHRGGQQGGARRGS